MTDYQIQQREEHRLRLVAESDRMRRVLALQLALDAEVLAHTQAKAENERLRAKVAELQAAALPPASATVCTLHGVEVYALHELIDGEAQVTAVHVAADADLIALLSSDDLQDLEFQIEADLAEQARNDADDAAESRYETQMLRLEA